MGFPTPKPAGWTKSPIRGKLLVALTGNQKENPPISAVRRHKRKVAESLWLGVDLPPSRTKWGGRVAGLEPATCWHSYHWVLGWGRYVSFK